MNIFNIKNPHRLFNIFIAFFITGSLSSCVSISKIRYLEPIGSNKNDWEVKKEKDAFFWNFYETRLTKRVNEANGENSGTVDLNFQFNWMYLWMHGYPWFALEVKGEKLVKQIVLDNLQVKSLSDSLNNKPNRTDLKKSSHNKPSAHLINDSLLVIEDLPVYLKNYSPSKDIWLNVGFRLKKSQRLKLITGNAALDSILKQYTFKVKTQTKIGLMTHMN